MILTYHFCRQLSFLVSCSFELNSYFTGLQGVRCGIYGANSAEWIMSMEVPFIFNLLPVGYLFNFFCHLLFIDGFLKE